MLCQSTGQPLGLMGEDEKGESGGLGGSSRVLFSHKLEDIGEGLSKERDRERGDG